MAARDFQAALREADRVMADRGLPAEVDQRLRQRLARPAPAERRAAMAAESARPTGRLRWWPVALAGACASLALVLSAARTRTVAPPADGLADALAVTEASADLALVRRADGVEVTGGRCTLLDEPSGSAIAVLAPSKVARERGGVRLLRGHVEVTVRKRRPDSDPARLLVSDGAIEVLGTRFTVVERGASGTVTLHEGRIRFVSRDGRTIELAPGEAHTWTRGPAPAPAPAPAPVAAPAPPAADPMPAAAPGSGLRPATRPVEPAEQVVERIALLRSRGEFRQAARELERALRLDYRPPARERLSYELGAILTYRIRDTGRACAHWRQHVRHHGGGRYEREVDQAMETAGCRARGR